MWTYASCLQPDGKVLVGGVFSQYNGLPQGRLIRLNPNGTVDETFDIGSGANYFVQSIKMQPDGKILVGGGFTIFNGFAQNRIVRLNSDGSIDPSFVLSGSGFDNVVYDILVLPDGKIMVGGEFDNYNGVPSKKIIRLNSDGTHDTSFNPGSGFNNSMRNMVLQPDGKIILTGPFTSYNGTTRNRIIRINANGSLDGTFNPGSGFNGQTWPVHLQSDGKIIVVGGFSTFNGVSRNRIARLNANGTLDTSFDPGTGFFATGGCNLTGMSVQADGKVIVGGTFTSFNGTAINRIARINTDGSLDNMFDPGTGANDDVTNIIALPSGQILIGGWFTNIDGHNHKYFGRLNANGQVDASYDPMINYTTGFNKSVRVIKEQADLKLLVGGEFTTFNGNYTTRFCRTFSDGTLDNSFVTGAGFDSTVLSVAIQTDGKIIVGGEFSTYDGNSTNGLVRLDDMGMVDPFFNIGTGFNGAVRSIILQPDGKLVVAGDFTLVDGISANRLVRLNSDGSMDGTFNTGTGFNGEVRSIVLQTDGKIIAAGLFNLVDGLPNNSIVRLNTDGTLDNTFTIGTGFNGDVRTLALQPDGLLMAGGTFTQYNGNTSNRIVRIQSNGLMDNSFNPGLGFNDTVYTIALQADGKIVVAGSFTDVDGNAQNRIGRLLPDGIIDAQFNSAGGFNNSVFNLVVSSNIEQSILVGGEYTLFDGVCRNGLASLVSDCSGFVGTIDATVNQSFATLSSVENVASFQWLDCNNGYLPVPGAISGVWTAFTTGTFALKINKSGCLIDTSNCFTVTAQDFYDDPSYLPLIGEVFALPVSVPDSCNAVATAFAVGGVPPYYYDWLTLPNPQVGQTADSICVGIHTLKVTDNIGDSVFVDYYVTDSANFYYWYDTFFSSFVDTIYVSAPNCLLNYSLPLDSGWISDTYYIGPDTIPFYELYFIEIVYYQTGTMYVHQDTISLNDYGVYLLDFSVYCPIKSLSSGEIKTFLTGFNAYLTNASNKGDAIKMQIYPNPANAKIHVSGITEGSQIEIFDMRGRLVHSFVLSSANHTVDIVDWPNGIYFVRAQSLTESVTLKFVKN